MFWRRLLLPSLASTWNKFSNTDGGGNRFLWNVRTRLFLSARNEYIILFKALHSPSFQIIEWRYSNTQHMFYTSQLHFPATSTYPSWAGRAQSVQRLAMSWAVRGSNPGEGEIFRTRPDRPWVSPNLLYNEYRSIPGDKAVGQWLWPLIRF
jgi:hypothetical protein